MRILVTGATGFVGTAACVRFREEGHEVHALVYSGSEGAGPAAHSWVGDICDETRLATILREVQPQAILHLAARTEVARSFDSAVSFSRVNYLGSVALIEQARVLPELPLVVLASTMETYGRQPEPWTPFTEDTAQNPCAPYSVAKVGAEYYLRYAGQVYGLPWVILRQTNTYGRPENDFFVVERIISQMLKGGAVRLGSPEPYRNFLYIDDLIDLYTLVLTRATAIGQVFCTGPPNAIRIRELADLVARLIGWTGVVQWNTQPPRSGEVFYLNSSHAKAERLLGWAPKVSLEEGLQRTIALWRAKE